MEIIIIIKKDPIDSGSKNYEIPRKKSNKKVQDLKEKAIKLYKRTKRTD